MPSMDRTSHLRELLAGYRPGDSKDAADHAAMMALLDVGEVALRRANFVPGHFTASAFVLDPNNELLLIHHDKLGMWLQPGGHIEPGDSDIIAAARRELHEEVGIVGAALVTPGIFDVDVHHIPAHGAEPAHAHFDVRFLFRSARAFGTATDAHDARWVPLGEVSATQSDASVMRAVARIATLATR
jgi:8-oxo-dGTP pyrophosphatase MutT (NUDIX family)